MRRRVVTTWLAFVVSAVLVLGGMAWVTQKALALEGARAMDQASSEHEERVRLALWRMDSTLAPILAGESARSHARYMEDSQDPGAEIALRFVFDEDGHASIRDAGEDSAEDGPTARFEAAVDFERLDVALPRTGLLDADALTVDAGWSDLATPRPAATGRRVARRGARPSARPNPAAAPSEAGEVAAAPNEPAAIVLGAGAERPNAPAMAQASLGNANQAPQQAAQMGSMSNAIQQQALNDNEFLRRAMSVQKSSSAKYSSSLGSYGQGWRLDEANQNLPQQQAVQQQAVQQQAVQPKPEPLEPVAADSTNKAATDTPAEPPPKKKKVERGISRVVDAVRVDPPTEARAPQPVTRVVPVREGVMHPIWVDDMLLLARRAEIDGRAFVEGASIDMAAVRSILNAEVQDLLPRATVEAVRGPAADTQRLLATLPLRLIPGEAPSPLIASTLKGPLTVAWICVLLALLGAWFLLRGAMALSERRGAFVSAVTHELRTPLTTFRMYTEMLSEGMVPDAERRQQYLNTLRREAHRLDNLVQNVLAYSRIEDDRARAQVESVSLGEFIAQVRPRLEERLQQADMTLVCDIDPATEDTTMRVDRTAAEQIMFNLVDNAAKYGINDHDPEVHLSASVTGDSVALRVTDSGPGIKQAEHALVFRPFSKAAVHEAGTAPGVGLGLALCRRLARQLGGELVLEPSEVGARFRLTLPRG